MKSMLDRSDWDHKETALSIHGPMTLDIQSSFKLKEGQVFLKSRIHSRHKDCANIKKHRPLSRDGVYTIYPTPETNKTVFCDMTTDGGGWTVIQRRTDGETNFYRNWKDYKKGFGHAEHEYWLGNDAIHELTKDKKQILRIDLMKFSRKKGHATYSSFFVDNEANKYRLTLGSFNGTKGVGDSLSGQSNNMYFSTMNSDNDNRKGNCAEIYKTAGWFNNCFSTNLNANDNYWGTKTGKLIFPNQEFLIRFTLHTHLNPKLGKMGKLRSLISEKSIAAVKFIIDRWNSNGKPDSKNSIHSTG
ncbi:ryncolin-1-like [Magallana gigas]|uniref:ryncolin-1-like n=1 Tax=Magallana gigas TaxID=29159 RepID=UPI00333F2F36